MPGYQRKFTGQPPSPPHWCALCMGQESTEGVEYFIETGVFAEHEGVIYLCNRCFEPLVLISEKFISLEEHKETIEVNSSAFDAIRSEYEHLKEQAELLHEFAGLRLSDLTKFRSLTNKLDALKVAVGELEVQKEQRSTRGLIEQQEIAQRKVLLDSINSQIEAKNKELQIHIEASLATKLEHIGRADLIPILLNNQLPDSVTDPSNGDERETDEDIREPDFSFPGLG